MLIRITTAKNGFDQKIKVFDFSANNHQCDNYLLILLKKKYLGILSFAQQHEYVVNR